MLDINQKYNSSKKVIAEFNKISFSLNTDLVFKKIDSIVAIKMVYTDGYNIKYRTKLNSIDGIIKHEKWDDIVTIMDENNDVAKEVYLVRDFLNKYKGIHIVNKAK